MFAWLTAGGCCRAAVLSWLPWSWLSCGIGLTAGAALAGTAMAATTSGLDTTPPRPVPVTSAGLIPASVARRAAAGDTFTPAADYNGPVSFTYVVSDGNGGTDTAEVVVMVNDGVVEGTGGDDLIDTAYTGDPEGDMVDAGDAILPGEVGDDDIIVAGAGDDKSMQLLQLQQAMNAQSQMFNTLTNVQKSKHDAAMAAIQNTR